MYLTLQGDNSVKSAKRFNYVVLFKEKLSFSISKLVFLCSVDRENGVKYLIWY